MLLRYFDGVVWTSHTTPRRSPTADASTIGRATPGVIPGRAGNPGLGAARPAGVADPPGPGPVAGRRGAAHRLQPLPAGLVGARDDVLPDGAVLAEWWRRLVGRILDLIVIAVLTLVVRAPVVGAGRLGDVGLLADGARAAESGGPAEPDGVRRADPHEVRCRSHWSASLVSLVYQTIFLTTRGATPGKMVVGTVVRRVGHPGS